MSEEHHVIAAALASGKKRHEKHKAKEPAEHPKHGKAKSFHADRAENGYVVHIGHEEPGKDTHHIAVDTDALHDLMEEHMGEPNPGEAEADAGDAGIPSDAAAEAQIPHAAEAVVPGSEEAGRG